MKAWVLHDINDFRYEEVTKPYCRDGEVLVKVKTTGICGSDIPRVYETGAHVKPLIIGHEFSGIVEKESQSLWSGKRVGIFPLIPCRKCEPCKKGFYEMCRNYSYLGSRRDGGFAEYVSVPETNLIELPHNVTYEQAAMLEPMAVSVHAMRRGIFLMNNKDIIHNTVVVWGLGTIGLLLAMFLKQSGVKKLLVIGNKDFQREKIKELNISADYYCDSRSNDVKSWISEHTEGNGPDLFFECVGKNEIVSDIIDIAKPGGSIVLVGNPYTDMNFPKNTFWKILRNQLKITGTWNSAFTGDVNDDWRYVLGCLERGEINPETLISHTYDLEHIIEGFDIMKNKKEDYIKIMMNNG